MQWQREWTASNGKARCTDGRRVGCEKKVMVERGEQEEEESSWRAVRKLAEVGLLTARKSVGVPESRGGGAAGMIGGRSAFSRTLSRIVLFCPALVARWRQAGATQIGRVGRYRRVLECQSPRPVLGAGVPGGLRQLFGRASQRVCVWAGCGLGGARGE